MLFRLVYRYKFNSYRVLSMVTDGYSRRVGGNSRTLLGKKVMDNSVIFLVRVVGWSVTERQPHKKGLR